MKRLVLAVFVSLLAGAASAQGPEAGRVLRVQMPGDVETLDPPARRSSAPSTRSRRSTTSC